MTAIAAMDIGSNAVRWAVALQTEAGIELCSARREPVRLGAGVFSSGQVDDTASEALQKAIAAFTDECAHYGVRNYRAVATSALRNASNGPELIQKILRQHQIEIELISGEEEARLIYEAVSASKAFDQGINVLVDIGGGSVEVSLYRGEHLHGSLSLKLGTLRTLRLFPEQHQNHAHRQQLWQAYFNHAAKQASEELGLSSEGVDRLIITGGNCEAIADLAVDYAGGRTNQSNHVLFSPGDLDQVATMIGARTVQERMEDFGHREDRADVIEPSGILLQCFCRALGVREICAPNVGLRDGLLQELSLGRSMVMAHRNKLVWDGARQLALRYHVDGEATESLVQLCLEIQHGLHIESAHNIEAIMMVAGWLHDAGRFINDHAHHKHSAYLIQHMPIVGLTSHERLLASLVARYHRKSRPKEKHSDFHALTAQDQTLVREMSDVLRIATAIYVSGVPDRTEISVAHKTLKIFVYHRGECALAQWATRKQAKKFVREDAIEVIWK